ncbi:hypothetical protein [Mycobacterium sp. 1245852.3]|uniref:hypothetical protein n=1 Tax=Mycobacterium sp. 1245852.3 TaxID=1856860 RepID=UPI0007FCDE09|nr:hypothetical protein [Mycobacterium sp. 1245852.3]OBK13610.1 hypothetical protein A9W96_09955 [Mycobacterium sp. 1245852.3]
MTFADAEMVRGRVETHAAQLGLRGARRHVLAAVLKLLCGWSRITDDRVALGQLVELIAAGGGRRYDLKTVGRALAALAADGLIVYRAAQGRNTRALVAINEQFTADIAVLARDRDGRVITCHTHSDADSVTFSRRLPYKNQSLYPPTPRNDELPSSSRPVEVEVSTDELRQVLAGLPEVLARLPKHLRFMLGAQIQNRLAAGWLPEQILDKLGRPMPADLQRPWRLALWRLHHNVPGAGPRLRPLQRAWEQRARCEAREAQDRTTAHWYAQVAAATSPAGRAELLQAHEVKFGRPVDPMAALAAAGRRVNRLFPQMPLAAALTRWADEILAHSTTNPVAVDGVSTAATIGTDLLMDLAISGGRQCMLCGSHRATMRPELPLKSMVCDQCWPVIAAELAGDGDHGHHEWVAA